METYYLMFIVCFLLIMQSRTRRKFISASKALRKKKENKIETEKDMKKLAENFVGKDCLIYTLSCESSAVKGTLKEVSDTAVLVEYKGNIQAVNLEYIVRIREWPTNSKGKKKSVI